MYFDRRIDSTRARVRTTGTTVAKASSRAMGVCRLVSRKPATYRSITERRLKMVAASQYRYTLPRCIDVVPTSMENSDSATTIFADGSAFRTASTMRLMKECWSFAPTGRPPLETSICIRINDSAKAIESRHVSLGLHALNFGWLHLQRKPEMRKIPSPRKICSCQVPPLPF